MTTCVCGAAVLWVKTQRGKSVPVDAAESLDGNVWVLECDGALVAIFPPDESGVTIPDATRHRSHLASCTAVSVHRHKSHGVRLPVGAVAVDVELQRLADDGCRYAADDELFPHEHGGEAG
jgi:hypothetical protein